MEKSIRAIKRDKLPEHRIQIKSWTVRDKTYDIRNVWYDLDKEEFLTYNPHYGGLIVIKIYGKTHRSVMIHDSEGNIHSASCKKLVKQNQTIST